MNIDDLRRAHDYTTLAALFGLPVSVFKNNLYKARGYTDFTIPKKSGGIRAISAPGKVRKRLQRMLLPILSDIYKIGPHVHGFAIGRSVRTNAVPHVSAGVVVNLDLQDFFASISFQRIRGVFLAHPMRLDWNVANIIAQICSLDGVMPAGAATSPVISNIICAKLDKRLSALAARLGGAYTRYADDLTFSFNRPVGQLRGIVVIDEEGKPVVGGAISEIISSEGFSINVDKFRVSAKGGRKIVTGLVVNEKVNVKRSWLNGLESKIYAIEKFGLAKIASSTFADEKRSDIAERKLIRRLHGKVSYLSMIRGRGDWVVADIAQRFNKLHEVKELRVPSVEIIRQKNRLPRGVHIVNASNIPLVIFDLAQSQGTAFNTASGLLVTAAHVIDNGYKTALEHIYVMNERKRNLVPCELLAVDWVRDVAILRAKNHRLDVERSRFKVGQNPVLGKNLTAVGYPNYGLGAHASVFGLPVIRIFETGAVKKASVGGFVQGGMSGGPVLNEQFEVCGIVHKGVQNAGGVAEIVAVSEVIHTAIQAGLRV